MLVVNGLYIYGLKLTLLCFLKLWCYEWIKEEVKQQKVRIKYINQKCGLKISKDLEFLPNDVKTVGIKMATTLLTDYYQQFEGCDSITRGIHKAAVEKVKVTQAEIAKKAEAAAKKK